LCVCLGFFSVFATVLLFVNREEGGFFYTSTEEKWGVTWSCYKFETHSLVCLRDGEGNFGEYFFLAFYFTSNLIFKNIF
jgi:hypothetical protein